MRNQPRLLRRQLPQILVHQRRRLLQNPKRPNQLRGHGVFANRKVHQRPRRLRPVIAVRRHLHLPHAVRFRARRPVRRCRPVPRCGKIRRGPPNLSHNPLHYHHPKSYSNPPPASGSFTTPRFHLKRVLATTASRWFTLRRRAGAFKRYYKPSITIDKTLNLRYSSPCYLDKTSQVLCFLSHPCKPSIIMELRTLLRNGSQISLAFSVASALFLSPRGWYPPPPAFCSACRICSMPLWPNSLIFNSLQPLCVLLASPALCFLSVTASFRKTPGGGGHISRRWFGGEEQEESQPPNQAPVRPRCCAHQARQASGCAAMEAPLMSRKAWKTQPRVASSRVISSVIFSRCGTARMRCSRVSIPDCANPHPPRSRTSGEGSLRKASSKGATVSSVPSMDNPSTAQYRVCSSGSCRWSISVTNARRVSTPRLPSTPSIQSAQGRAEGSRRTRSIRLSALTARFGRLYPASSISSAAARTCKSLEFKAVIRRLESCPCNSNCPNQLSTDLPISSSAPS